MNNLEFALELKNKRLASGLSQGQLASLTHVSRYSINRFENGKANASKETKNIILRCLNYYVSEKPFYLLIDYLSVRFPTTDALEVIRKVLGMKTKYFIHYDYGYYGYKEHYTYGEIKVMASDDEQHMGVFVELKGEGSRNMEHVLQAQHRDWYAFLNRCLDCGALSVVLTWQSMICAVCWIFLCCLKNTAMVERNVAVKILKMSMVEN
ncbi:helix-turn-helix domain-containing protein [Clostridioides difficile]|uniref:helix-turn-helix domain-containing protein n=1 Tax=Clostridioides difficile TaxID=1496 RepID=UPI000B21BCB7|nr:helix-turn-helix domain-containing protein [Clostridioides difficile]MDV9235747.1 helix-turn-helix domain-containing protein [Clostridioides difficile]MDX5648261.1 helix-turn-helix domain-containing protein [Clostridioides difficile]MEC5403831.1 helix-turn-helix domain-containing protein [Clostridioides difficile]